MLLQSDEEISGPAFRFGQNKEEKPAPAFGFPPNEEKILPSGLIEPLSEEGIPLPAFRRLQSDEKKALKIEGRNLTAVLRNLERCDFIAKMARFPNKSTDAIYRLVDFYTLFYYKFLAEDMSGDEQWWSHNFQSHSVDLGIIVLLHISQ